MKLYIKNKLLSLKGNSSVFDENDNLVYKVKGKFFSITKKKFIKDTDNNTLYMIRNKFWNGLTHSVYLYDDKKNKIAQLKVRFSLSPKYDLLGYKDELSIQGKPLSFNYQIYRNDQLLGSIKRDIFKLTDCFVLDIVNDEDAPLFVALVIGIDNISDRKRK